MSVAQIINGDARRLPLADGSVHCCVTSPPYFGLRDYGVAGQIGLEPTPDEFVAAMVRVFREVRRCLRDDGTLWLNLGDSYGGERWSTTPSTTGISRSCSDIKRPRGGMAKQLLGIPWRVAFALQANGWYLRSDIIWAKPNPMPESVTDRPTKSHEYLFLLAKSERYYFDAEAVREGFADNRNGMSGSYSRGHGDLNPYGRQHAEMPVNPAGRNIRSVWSIATEPYPGSHFATYPRNLVEPCVKAGTSERGCCPACGAPWVRCVEREWVATRPGLTSKIYQAAPLDPGSPYQSHAGDICGNRDPGRHCTTTTTTGWRPSCDCPAHDPIPCTVLDPFNGSGTTGVVATGLGRRYVGVDLNPEYCRMAVKRIERPHASHRTPRNDAPLPLFAGADA